MVVCVPEYDSTEHRLLDISTKQFCTIKNDVFQDASCIYSKEGWLLLMLGSSHPQSQRAGFILLNPCTGARFDLPRIDKYERGPFTFSTKSGVPDRVIHVNNGQHAISICMICPGDEAWKVYDEFRRRKQWTSISDVTLVGMHVLCFDRTGTFVTFDLSEQDWMLFSQRDSGIRGHKYTVEGEGQIVRVCCPYPRFSSFNFFRLDLRRIDWVELDDVELENTSWFLGRRCSCRAKEKGKKVYTLRPNESEVPNAPEFKRGMKRVVVQARPVGADIEPNVYIHSLVDGSHESLLPSSFLTRKAFWLGLH